MSDAAASVVSLATVPVSESEPTGGPALYDPSYEALRVEIDKLSGVAVADIDWNRILGLASEILQHKSKDLLVASYLCRALFQTGGLPALTEGLKMIHQLVATHWEGLFPQRPKGRAAALEWLSEKVGAAVSQTEVASGEAPILEAAVAAARELDAILKERLEGGASLEPLISALRSCTVEEGTPRPEPQGTALSQARGTAAAAEDLSTPEGVERTIKASLTSLRNAARRVRAAASHDPMPYRVSRLAAWSRLSAPPPVSEGRTRVPSPAGQPPPTERLENLRAQQQWPLLLHEAENLFEGSIFWLDAHWYVAEAMAALGAGHAAAHAVVMEELRILLLRFPGLQDLLFSDGAAFASARTKAWIASDVQRGGPPGSEASPMPSQAASVAGRDEAFEEALAQARSLASRKQMREAVGLVWTAAGSAGSRQIRFHRRLALGRLLAERSEYRLGAALLEALDEEVARFGLEEWDPGLALDTLRLLLTCRRALSRDDAKAPGGAERNEDLYGRIARLDLRAALELGSR